MNNSTYELLTQQLHDKDQKMIDQVKELQARAQRIDFLEREVADLKDQNQGLYDDKAMLEKNVQFLRDEDERLKRDVEFYTKRYNDLAEQLKMETAALHRIRDDIDYRKTGIEFLEAMDSYLQAQQDDMLFDPSTEIYKLYEDLCNLYHSVT